MHVEAKPPSLLEELLSDQQNLSAVERFARRHDSSEQAEPGSIYRDRIPLSTPGLGEQYAFDVDLDACTGCKACVAACHNLNGLEEGEQWRHVGLLVGDREGEPYLQHVTSACHHCVEPACLEGCPVDAYDKDAVTGIVRHLDDQCIGCRYCMFKCPYDVPVYSERLGIVRKCDLCHGRLTSGEAPACVQGCPNSAIRVTIVDQGELAARAHDGRFIETAPDPRTTKPATLYQSSFERPEHVSAGDHSALRPQLPHTPLAVMLILTQLSVGTFLVGRLVELVGVVVGEVHTVLALAAGILGLGASTLHLGRPQYAWRAVLGVRRSWLSREVLAFGLFAGLAMLFSVTGFFPALSTGRAVLGVGVVAAGLAGLACSVMLYHDTKRSFWQWSLSGSRFLLSTAILGVATTLLAGVIAAATQSDTSSAEFLAGAGRPLAGFLVACVALKLVIEASIFRHIRHPDGTPLKRSALLLSGELYQPMALRFIIGWLGGIAIPGFFLIGAGPLFGNTVVAVSVSAAFLLTLLGELLERRLFFRAVTPPRMPGAALA